MPLFRNSSIKGARYQRTIYGPMPLLRRRPRIYNAYWAISATRTPYREPLHKPSRDLVPFTFFAPVLVSQMSPTTSPFGTCQPSCGIEPMPSMFGGPF